MAEAELAELAEDIRKHGLREPITLYNGAILDGRNRYAACKRTGMEPRFVEATPADLNGGPASYMLSRNLYRRHLDAEQKRSAIAAVLRENPAQSDRQIGKKTKADHKTVAAVRRGMEDVGSIPHVETREDTKGRKQPTKKTTKKSHDRDLEREREREQKEWEQEDAKLQAAVRSLKEQERASDEYLRKKREAQRKGFAPPSRLQVAIACVRELSDDEKTQFGRWWNYERLNESTQGGNP
jgi:hypothetical protein